MQKKIFNVIREYVMLPCKALLRRGKILLKCIKGHPKRNYFARLMLVFLLAAFVGGVLKNTMREYITIGFGDAKIAPHAQEVNMIEKEKELYSRVIPMNPDPKEEDSMAGETK